MFMRTVSVNWGRFCGCAYNKGPSIWVSIRAPDSWKLPYELRSIKILGESKGHGSYISRIPM